MIVAKQMEIRANIKEYFDMAASGEVLFVPRIANKNIFIISQQMYEDFLENARGAENVPYERHASGDGKIKKKK